MARVAGVGGLGSAAWLVHAGRFLVGALYLLVLGRRLFNLRRGGEFPGGDTAAGLCVCGCHWGVAAGRPAGPLPDKLFFSLYACAIGVALFLCSWPWACGPAWRLR